MTRLARTLIFATLLGGVPAFAGDGASCQAAVVFRSGSEAYDQAVAGTKEALASAPCQIRYIDLAESGGAATLAQTIALSPRLIAAFGVGAVDRLADIRSHPPLLPALILRADLKLDASQRAGAVFADVPLALIADRLHAAFPGKSRLGLIRRAAQVVPDAAVLTRLHQSGFDLLIVECPGPDKLLDVFQSLKGKVDFVIAQPDVELYNSATLKPLVMASLENRLPIVGFSAAFVRAGALAGVYPDFHELGKQTGELMIRILSGHSTHLDEEPRAVVISVNPRIARLIGLEPQIKEGVVILK